MRTFSLLLVAVLLGSCQTQNEQQSAAPKNALTKLQVSLDSLFNAEIKTDEPGAALMISFENELVVAKGYGLRDVENQLPITPSTNLRMASVSKQFTALSIMRLIDDGKLSLSDSVNRLFPSETFKHVTVEQLINHTSGRADAENAFFEEWDRSKTPTNKDILDWYLAEDRSIDRPGEKYIYNNGIYEFIPMIVEKLSGEGFAQFAKQEIFDKAGMDRTNFFSLANPIEIEERAYCYQRDDKGEWQKVDGHFLNGLVGAGGLYTSVNDYFAYDQALRNKALFTAETHDLIFKPSSSYIDEGVERYYAMGWGVTDSTARHTGGWFGTNTLTKRYLKKPLSYAIFMNRNTLFSSGLAQKTDSIITVFLASVE